MRNPIEAFELWFLLETKGAYKLDRKDYKPHQIEMEKHYKIYARWLLLNTVLHWIFGITFFVPMLLAALVTAVSETIERSVFCAWDYKLRDYIRDKQIELYKDHQDDLQGSDPDY